MISQEIEPTDVNVTTIISTHIEPDLLGMDQIDLISNNNTEKGRSSKVAWLHSQLIGNDAQIDTPFGTRLLVYADHTASGRSLRFIENYIVEKVLPFYGNTHTSDSHVGSVMSKMAHEAAAYVKRCLSGGPSDSLLFCGSGTTAAIKRLQETMGIAVPSVLRHRLLSTMREEERWVVFVGPYEHHSNLLSWRNSLAEVVEIGLDCDGAIDMEALKVELSSEKYANRPMLGSFSACSNVTGIYTDTRAIARLLHQHGAFACFDFAASGPYVKMDMRSGEIDGYDAIFISPHKFVGGPGTPGILLMSEDLYQLKSSPPSTCGGGTVAYVNGFDEQDTLYYESIEEREDAGTPPIIQKIRAALTFWVKEYIGYDMIESQEHAYFEATLQRLRSNQNIDILGNVDAPRQPIISFVVYPEGKKRGKPLHGRFVAKLLNDLFGVQVRGGCACAGPYGHDLLGVDQDTSLALRSQIVKLRFRNPTFPIHTETGDELNPLYIAHSMGYEGLKPGWTRVSFSYYMSKEELEFVLEAIEFVAEHGSRFLPLYRFNWKNGDWNFRLRSRKYRLIGEEKLLALSDLTLDTKKKNNMSIITYRTYLDIARQIVGSLPEDRSPRSVPVAIDPSLVLFEI